MKRIILKLIALTFIVSIGVLYYFPVLNGKPPFHGLHQLGNELELLYAKIQTFSFSTPDLSLPSNDLSLESLTNPDPATTNQTTTIYRWQDENGQWQFSNNPPTSGQSLSVLHVDPNANLIQSLPESTTPITSDETPKKIETPQTTQNPYSAETIKKLFEQAEQAKQHIQQRNDVLNKLDNNQ